MRKPLFLCGLIVFALIALVVWAVRSKPTTPSILLPSSTKPEIQTTETIVAENLEIPWEIAFLEDGAMLVTERPGRLVKIAEDRTVIPIDGVVHVGEGGLLGLTLHPRFTSNHWIYLYLTSREDSRTVNRVERYKLSDLRLDDRVVVLDNIPGSQFHDGGRIAFGPDGYLYITTGDAQQEQLAQDRQSLAGKILRVVDDGSIPLENPFGNAVYSYGHRNPQGITWDEKGQLWATEHGRSGVLSGLDELNRIEKGKNYGWPVIQGDEERSGMKRPVLHSGPNDTWAPASAVYWDGSIFFGGLRGEALYEVKVDDGSFNLKTHLKGMYGRIRAVTVGPDGMLYLSTSNTDGRGTVRSEDDKIIRVDPRQL